MDNTGRMSGTINKQWFLYQEKEVFQDKRQKKLILGIPNELEKGENRICLTPESVHILVSMGHEVLILSLIHISRARPGGKYGLVYSG